jgi:hypothetical protein
MGKLKRGWVKLKTKKLGCSKINVAFSPKFLFIACDVWEQTEKTRRD